MLNKLAKKLSQLFFHRIIVVRFGEIEMAKEKFYAPKSPVKIWDVNTDNTVVSKLVEAKSTSKHFIGIKFNKYVRPLVLVMPKMGGYVKTFKVKEVYNNLMSFRVDDEKLLEKYKAIWSMIEDLKNI